MTKQSEKTRQPKRPWSIASLLRQEEREWFMSNDLRRRLRYGWFGREILKGTEQPFRYAASLVTLLILVVANGYLIPENWFVGRWSSWGPSEQLSYFTTLWGIQSTIAALVYPFVISFVTLLLQRRPASKAFLQIYLIDSGALVAGLSSLFLVLSMTFEYILLAKYSLGFAVTWVAVNSVWFFYNVVLTIWFLFRTVEFLRTDFQMEVVRRYAINVALPREVANLLRFQLFANAQKNGWILGPDYLDDEAEGKPQVLMRSFGLRMGLPAVEMRLHERSRLSNVLYWPLRIAVSGWLKTAQKSFAPGNGSILDKPKSALLILPVVPGGVYETSVALARVDGGPPLSLLQRFLVSMSFRFTPIRAERRHVSSADILAEIETDARVSAANGDVAGFEDSYDNVTTMHRSLLGASLAKSDEGETGSWALIPDVHRFADRPLHTHWTNTYRSIFDAAVSLLPKETRPLKRLCHVVQKLNDPFIQKSPVEIRDDLMLLPPRLMYALANWWSMRLEEQGILEHGQNRMALLRPPLQGAYEEALVHFVGGWDSARTALASLPDRDDKFSWSDAKDLLGLNMRHINQTGLMLLKAVARGDQAAAEWMSDVLSKWWSNASRYDHEPFVLYGKTDFITVESASQMWPAVMQSLGLDEHDQRFIGLDQSGLQRHVFLAAIKNYWKDISLLTIEILLSWATSEDADINDSSLAMYVSGGLLLGRHWRAGGRTEESLIILDAPDYLAAKARQFAADSGYRQGYIARLDSFVEGARDILRPDMVPGRIYSYSGADDVESLQDAQLALLAVLSSTDWKPGESLRRQLATWISSRFTSTEILENRAEAMKSRLDDVGDQLCAELVDRLIHATNMTHTKSQGVARAKAGINALLDEIAGLQSDAVASAQVSAQRLNEIEEAASEQGFVATRGEFPIQIFKDIIHDSASRKAFTLTISKQRKGEFTAIEMAQRAVNENEYYANAIASHVGALLLSDVVRQCKIRDVIAPDANAYWAALKEEAHHLIEQGLTPLLILDNPTRPDWIWEWQYPEMDGAYPRPADLAIRQEKDGRGDGYICDLNDIQVFSGPVVPGESLLISRESFLRVFFKEYRKGVFVNAETSEVPESKTLVDLKLSFERAVEVAFPTIVRIRYEVPASRDSSQTEN